jgi:hypothetical protein
VPRPTHAVESARAVALEGDRSFEPESAYGAVEGPPFAATSQLMGLGFEAKLAALLTHGEGVAEAAGVFMALERG